MNSFRPGTRASSIFFIASLLCSSLAFSDGDGMKGRLGIGGFGGQAIPLGGEVLRDRGDVGSDAMGTLRYGLAPNWAVGASYENIYLQDGIRREPLTLSALYYATPDKRWSPVGEVGVGAAASTPGGPFTNFSMKAGIAAEFFVTHWFSVGPQLSFHYISATGKASFPSWIMSPGVAAMLYFGGSEEEQKTPVTSKP